MPEIKIDDRHIMKDKTITLKLIVMNFLQYAIWGAYLTSMGRYLANAGLGNKIGLFFSMQGIVSIFMPALVGIVADRFIQAQKVLSGCHILSGLFMLSAWWYASNAADAVQFGPLFTLYSLAVAFYMPTIALSNSVAYAGLEGAGKDIVKAFPPIRVFGTVGFICSMITVDLLGFQNTPSQFMMSGILGLLLGLYAITMLPAVPVKKIQSASFAEASGLKAFTLFKNGQMAIFFIFSMLLGAALQITNGFANPFLGSFGADASLAGTFGVKHSNILISLSQMSETLCILLIPFAMKRFGIKKVMLIAMFAWVFRFGFFGVGNPAFPGVIWFVLSMIVYGVAFDFFNISGSLYVNRKTTDDIRSSAQGLFMLMTNGLGATIGTLAAQKVVNLFTHFEEVEIGGQMIGITAGNTPSSWPAVWFIFAGYALIVGILFAILFKDPGKDTVDMDPDFNPEAENPAA